MYFIFEGEKSPLSVRSETSSLLNKLSNEAIFKSRVLRHDFLRLKNLTEAYIQIVETIWGKCLFWNIWTSDIGKSSVYSARQKDKRGAVELSSNKINREENKLCQIAECYLRCTHDIRKLTVISEATPFALSRNTAFLKKD